MARTRRSWTCLARATISVRGRPRCSPTISHPKRVRWSSPPACRWPSERVCCSARRSFSGGSLERPRHGLKAVPYVLRSVSTYGYYARQYVWVLRSVRRAPSSGVPQARVLSRDVLQRILVELLLAACRAEVVRRAAVLGHAHGLRFIDLHVAHGIGHH